MNDMIDMKAERAVPIRLDQIRPNPDQVRKHFGRSGIQSMGLNASDIGLLYPIIIRQTGVEDGRSIYQIVDGERRYRAITALGLKTIKCFIRSMSDSAAMRAQAAANTYHEPFRASEVLNRIQQMYKAGIPDAEIIRDFKPGTSDWAVRILRLVKYGIPELQAAVERGQTHTGSGPRLDVKSATIIVGYSDWKSANHGSDFQRKVLKLVTECPLTKENLEAAMRTWKSGGNISLEDAIRSQYEAQKEEEGYGITITFKVLPEIYEKLKTKGSSNPSTAAKTLVLQFL